MGLSRVLKNGLQVTTKSCGNQTITQVLDNAGNIVKTRIKSIEHHLIPPKSARTIGFHQSDNVGKSKDIITIKKNIFENTESAWERNSQYSVLDKVYKDGEKVGERLVYTKAVSEKPMEAKEMFDSFSNDTERNKVLRAFENGQLIKENKYTYKGKLRRTRQKTFDADINVQIKALKDELSKLRSKMHIYENKRPRVYEFKKQKYDVDREVTALENAIAAPGKLPKSQLKEMRAAIKEGKKTFGHLANLIGKVKKRTAEYDKKFKEFYDYYFNRQVELHNQIHNLKSQIGEIVEFNGKSLRTEINGFEFTL